MLLLFFMAEPDALEPGPGVITAGAFAGVAGPVTVPLAILGVTR